jgi:hypothetical protein
MIPNVSKFNLSRSPIKTIACQSDACVIAFQDGRILTVEDQGQSCCEYRHMSCDDDLPSYAGATVLAIEIALSGGAGSLNDEDETQFLRVITDRGIITFVNHNEHNGYYGGFDVKAVWTAQR